MNSSTSDSRWILVHLACMDIGWSVASSRTELLYLRLSQSVVWGMHTLSYMRRVIHKFRRPEFIKHYNERRQWWINTDITGTQNLLRVIIFVHSIQCMCIKWMNIFNKKNFIIWSTQLSRWWIITATFNSMLYRWT